MIWNVVVFCLYGIDKYRSMTNQYRISEKTLLISSACLGGLGAVVGMYIWRHKTRKWYFHLVSGIGLYAVYSVYHWLS